MSTDWDRAIWGHHYFGFANYGASFWIHIWKYVIRIGKFWAPYKYVWRPFISVFRCWR